jgi:hypothetical protein
VSTQPTSPQSVAVPTALSCGQSKLPICGDNGTFAVVVAVEGKAVAAFPRQDNTRQTGIRNGSLPPARPTGKCRSLGLDWVVMVGGSAVSRRWGRGRGKEMRGGTEKRQEIYCRGRTDSVSGSVVVEYSFSSALVPV